MYNWQPASNGSDNGLATCHYLKQNDSLVYWRIYSISQEICTWFLLCCALLWLYIDFPISIRLTSLALWQSNDCPSASKAPLMNMDKYFMWIHYERLHKHNKAKHNKTVCIFLGIYSMPHSASISEARDMESPVDYCQRLQSSHLFCRQKTGVNHLCYQICERHLRPVTLYEIWVQEGFEGEFPILKQPVC